MSSPQHLRACSVTADRETSRRIRVLTIRLGSIRRVVETLRIGEGTYEAARDGGRMQSGTMVKLLSALDRAEQP